MIAGTESCSGSEKADKVANVFLTCCLLDFYLICLPPLLTAVKKLLPLYVTPLLGVVLIALKIPDVDDWLNSKFNNATLIIGMTVVGATIVNHVTTVISPFKKYEKIEKNKWALLDILFNAVASDPFFQQFKLTANIMGIDKVLWDNLEPRSPEIRWWHRFRRKVLKVLWVPDNRTMDKRLKLTVNQGVSGISYKTGRPAIQDMTVADLDELKLNDKQKSMISGKGFIISYPIFALDERYHRLSSNKIIGIVNFSCSNFGSESLIATDQNRQILTDKIVDFSRVCSLIM